MIQKNIIQTFAARYFILILNFGLVILTANLWGSEGKGIISLLIANLVIVGFFSGIFTGGSISFFASKFPQSLILFYAYFWSVIAGVSISLLFAFSVSGELLVYLVLISVVSALYNTNLNFFLGVKDIKSYNLYSVIQLLVHLLFILCLVFIIGDHQPVSYFKAMFAAYLLLFAMSFLQIRKEIFFREISFSADVFFKMLTYGFNTQISALLQFLNYRLSYYFLEFYRGMSSLGVFSVAVAISEAIWMVSRSLALVLYSEAVNTGNSNHLLYQTKASIKYSFYITLLFLIILIMVPSRFYIFIFGSDFHQTKEIILMLSPGILIMAVSNVMGYYFAGINKLKILNLKSAVGLLFTLALSFFLIPKWGIIGACFATVVSYTASSVVLFLEFYRITPFRINDYLFSKSELKVLLQKLAKK